MSKKDIKSNRQQAILYPSPFTAGCALDCVEHWAAGCLLLRETGMFRNGRLDGLLVKSHWKSVIRECGFYGIEVKVSRSDFLTGLKTGQYTRYNEALNGLYLATGIRVCKTSEIPAGVGHLIVARRGSDLVCVCRRHADYSEANCKMTEELLWRWVIDIGDQFAKREREIKKQVRQSINRLNDIASRKVMRYLARVAKESA